MPWTASGLVAEPRAVGPLAAPDHRHDRWRVGLGEVVAVHVEPVFLDRVHLGRVEADARVADGRSLPVASPQRIRPYQAFIASEEDSWLLPSPNVACPEAQRVAGVGVEVRAGTGTSGRRGRLLRCRGSAA